MFSRILPAAHEVSPSLDMFVYYHLSCLLKFSFGGIFQEYELTEQCLPLQPMNKVSLSCPVMK